MNDKEIWDRMWENKPFWERTHQEEIEHKKWLKELKEYYKNN